MDGRQKQNIAFGTLEKYVDAFSQAVADNVPVHRMAQTVVKHLAENQKLLERVDTAMDFLPKAKEVIGEYLDLTNAAAKNLTKSMCQASDLVYSDPSMRHAVPAADNMLQGGVEYSKASQDMLSELSSKTQDKDVQYSLGVTSGHYLAAQEAMMDRRRDGLIQTLQSQTMAEYALEDARANHLLEMPKKQHTGIVLNTLDSGDGKHDTLILADANKKLYAFPVAKGHGLERGDIARAQRKSLDDFFSVSRVNEQTKDKNISKGIGD